MSNDVKLVIVGTFSILALAWVAVNAGPISTLTGALASNYATAVNALKPGAGG